MKIRKTTISLAFLESEGHVLLVRARARPDKWGLPGGHIEAGESPLEACRRELKEEVGLEGASYEWDVRLPWRDDAIYLCGLSIPGLPVPKHADGEITASSWLSLPVAGSVLDHCLGSAVHVGSIMAGSPSPLALARLISDGFVLSPAAIMNSRLFKLRVSGTGDADRPQGGRDGADEVTHRPTMAWLSDATIEKCAGLPITLGHASTGLSSDEFLAGHMVGSILRAYAGELEGEPALMGIGRVYSLSLANAMMGGDWTTSPQSLGGDKTMEGRGWKVEDAPKYMDSLALLEPPRLGVWDKDGLPRGVVVEW